MAIPPPRRYEAIVEVREPVYCECGTLIGWVVFRDGRLHRLEIFGLHHERRHTRVISAEELADKDSPALLT